MHAFHAYASGKDLPDKNSKAVLIVCPNWFGDSIMAMPAIQAYSRLHPETRLNILVKSKCHSLWTMHPDIDAIWNYPCNLAGLIKTINSLRKEMFHTAFVLPNSFRSALFPFLLHIPCRVGTAGHQRAWMLTDIVKLQSLLGQKHQCYEYMQIMGIKDKEVEPPKITIPPVSITHIKERFFHDHGISIGFFPGAAYGPSKRWPSDSFIKLGRILKESLQCNILLLGSSKESALCAQVCNGIGKEAVNLAGSTSLPELAATLSLCKLVIANDSGGAHLASAVGTPVLVIFGITDSEKTGPLGKNVTVLQNSDIQKRKLKRISKAATKNLRQIRPEHVFKVACRILNGQ